MSIRDRRRSGSVALSRVIGNPDDMAYPSSTGSAANMYWESFVALSSKNIIRMRMKAAYSYNCRMGLYTNNVDVPDALLAYSLGTSVVSGSWNNIPLVSPVRVKAGETYWIALQMDTNSTFYRVDTGGITKYKAVTYTDPFPATAPGGLGSSTANWAISAYGR